MSTEIAGLVVSINSTDAVDARKNLDEMAGAGERAEQSIKKTSRSWIESIEKVAASTAATSSKMDSMSGTQTKLLAVVERMAASLDAMSAAYARNAGQATSMQQAATKTSAAMAKLDSDAKAATTQLDKVAPAVVRTTDALNKVDQSARTAGAGLDDAGKKASAAGKSVDGLDSIVRRAAAAFSAWKIIDSADQWGQLSSRLKVATSSTAEYTEAQSRLMEISNRSYKSFSGSSELYIRTADSLKQLGYSSSQSLDQVEALTYGLVVSAADTQKSASVIDAWSKAIMLGKMEMDGFQTIVSGAPRLQKALADSLGVTNAGLLAMVSAGELTADKMARITSQIGILGAEADKMPVTVRDAMIRLDNSFTKWIGTVNESTGATRIFTGAIGLLSDNVGTAVTLVTTLVAVKLASWLTAAVTAAGGAAAAIAAASTAVTGFVAAMGPIGWTVLALGTLATAWQLVGSSAAQSGHDQETAGEQAIAKANDLQGTVNNLIEKYRQLGQAAKGALGYATQANQYNDQRAGLNTQLQMLEAQKERIRLQAESNRLAAAAGTGERKGLATGVITGGKPVDPTLTQMYGDKGANANAVTDVIYLDSQIKAVRQSLLVLDQTKADADRSMANAYLRSDESLTKEQQKIWATAEVWNKYYQALERAPEQWAKIDAARDEQLRKVEEKFKEKAGPKGPKAPAEPTDYNPQIAAIEQAAKAESDILARAARDNEAAYQVGKKSAYEYYTTKTELATQAELVAVDTGAAELAVIERFIASGKGTAAEQRKWAADRAKVVSETSRAVLNAFEAEARGAEELQQYWLGFQRGWTSAAESSADAAEEQAKALRDQIDQYGMSKGAIADLVAVRAREEESMARTRLAMTIMRGARADEIELIEKEVAALGRRADALAGAAVDTYEVERLEAQDKFTEEAKRQNEQIGDSLTDALMRGFEDGAGFAENFKTTMVNLFKTMVLKPIIQPIAQGAANYVTSALGLTGGAGAGTAAGGQSLMGTASNLSSLYSAFTGDSMIGRGLSAIGSYFGGGAATAAFGATGGFAGLAASTAAANAGIAGTLGGFGAIGSATAPVIGGALGGGAAASGLALSGGTLVSAGTVGGAAAAVGGGTAAAGAAAAGGATAGSMAAAAIPYIGWAIAAAAVLSTFIGSDKTPAVGGNALTKIGAEGTASADLDDVREKFYGDDRGYKGPSAGLTTGLSALGDQIAATAKLYGGNAEGLSIYGQTAQSPDGQGASGGTALYDKNGTQIFGSSFEGKNEELEANVALSMKRALLGGLKAADLAPEFAKVFEGYGDNLGTLSEEQIASITAALEAVRSMNTMFDGLSHTFPELEKLGWEARTALTGFSGGLDALTSNLGSFYETYYTESERMGDTLASMTETFKGLSLEVPGTKDEFKSLVESLDLTTEAGQKAYATLLGMNQTFAGWADYAAAGAKAITDALQANEDSYAKGYSTEAERNAKSMESMRAAFIGLGLAVPSTREGFRTLVESLDVTTETGRKARATLLGVSTDFGTFADRITTVVTAARDAAETAATGAMSTLTRSVNTEKNLLTKAWQDRQIILQEGIDTASTALSNHKALSDRVKSTLNSMFGQTDAAMQRSQAQAQIAGALATARAGGGLPDVATLENALGIVSQPSQALFATFEDYQVDFLKTANDIAALGALTDSQLSIDERTLALLKDQLKNEQKAYDEQIKYYDQMLETAQAQLDAALGNTEATLTVAQALSALAASLSSLGASKGGVPTGVGGGAPAGLSASEQAIWDAYKSTGIGYLDAGGWSFWNEAIKNGHSVDEVTQQIIDINNGKNKAAVDGSHATGLWSVPRDGYIAELHEEETVLPAPEARAYRSLQNMPRGGGDSAEVVAELRSLRQEVQMLRAEAQATAQNTGRAAKQLTRWDVDGMPETREEATA